MSGRSFRLTEHVTPEHQAQIDCTDMLRKVLRSDVAWTAIDHANAKNRITGAIRKARGVCAGIPDYLFWDNGRGYAIEFKAADGTLSDNQRAFLKWMIAARIEVAVCFNQRQVFDRVVAWGLTRQLRVVA